MSKLAAHLKVHDDSGRLSFLPVYLSTRSRLSAMDVEVARGAQVRARSRWVEEGESFSAYFFRLLVLLLLFFLLIKKRHLTGLIGRSYVLLYMQWVLGSLLLGG